MSTWENTTYTVGDKECKALTQTMNDFVYFIITYDKMIVILENDAVVTSSLTSVADAKEYLKRNMKSNRPIRRFLDGSRINAPKDNSPSTVRKTVTSRVRKSTAPEGS